MGRPSSAYTKREQEQDRKFWCVLYDSPETECKLNRLPFWWQSFYYIYHDQDTYGEDDLDDYIIKHPGQDPPFAIGDPKKPHYHCIGVSANPLVLGRAAIKFDVESNYVQRIKNLKSAVRYLCHLDNPGKYQYDSDNIVTNDLDIKRFFKESEDSDFKAGKLLDFISSFQGRLSMADVVRFAIQNNCWDELRRGQHIFSQLIADFNYYGGFKK